MGGRLQLAAAAALALRGRGQPAAGDPDEEAGLFDCGLGAERFRAVRGARSGEAGVEAGGCQWVRVVGASFLPGHAGGVASASRSFSEAKAACEEMGEGCAGVTLQPCATEDDLVYSLRASRDWHASPYGETSWLKECGASEEAPEAEAAPASAERCGEDRFVRLREAASDFYADGVVSVHLLLYFGEALREAAGDGWKRLASRCAPAALQALLLRAEEHRFLDGGERAAIEALYLGTLHAALDSGRVPSEEWARWPLARGWQRAGGSPMPSRGGAAGQTVDFVLCFCGVSKSPGGGYPEVEDSLGWLVQLLAPGAEKYRDRTRVFIKEKCGDAAGDGFHAALAAALEPVAHVVEVERVEDALRADDATAYLAHLAGPRYSDLATWTFFLHADAPEHVHPFRLLEDIVVAVRSGTLDSDQFPFMYLSHNYLDLGTSRHTWDDFASPLLWRRLFGSSVAPPREDVKGYCCVQFLVPRPRALLRRQSWYADAFRWFASYESYWSLFPAGRLVTWQDLTCRAPAQLWMPWWHVVFGEDLACPERHLDPRLPLFVQIRSIPPDRIHCC